MTTSQGEPATTGRACGAAGGLGCYRGGLRALVAPQEVELANEALRLVGLRPGERFLDVAAGSGGP